MRNTFVNSIIENCSERDDIFIISGDAGYGVFDDFQEKYPDRFLNLGVAEQNMISFASGMALSGFKVVVYNIIPFVLYRCYEQVRNDVCYQNAPVVLVGIGSGVTYSPQGMTHYSVEDIGVCQTIPNIEVFSPIDPVEAKLCAEYSLTAKNPVYVRLAKRGEPVIHKIENFNINKPQVIYDGEDIALVFHGSISEEVMEAVEILHLQKIYPKVISCCKVQTFEFKEFLNVMQLSYNLESDENIRVKVEREKQTTEGRRIDIFVNINDDFIIAIENKPWAAEGDKQLQDYADFLEKKKRDFCLIFLAGWERETQSINEEKKQKLKEKGSFIETTYNDFLIPWLKSCYKECEAEKIRWFLKDLISWIEREFKREEER
jgi:transketolase